MTAREKFAALVAVLGSVALGAIPVARSGDDCELVQILASERNGAALAAAGFGPAELAAAGVVLLPGAVLHVVLCGDERAAIPLLPDAQIIGPAGTRGLTSDGVGVAGQTTTEVDATGRWSGPIGVAYRCAPDPDRPGHLNAACNSECAACDDESPGAVAQRAQITALGIAYDCGLWRASGRDCRAGVP